MNHVWCVKVGFKFVQNLTNFPCSGNGIILEGDDADSCSVNNFCTWLVMPVMLLINAYSVINGCSSFPALYITDLMMASMTVELLPRLGCANIVVTGLSGRLLMDVDCWAKKPMLAHFPKSKCPFYPGVCSWHLANPSDPSPKSVSVTPSQVEVRLI